VPLRETQRQDVHKATLKQAADLHAAPQGRHPFTLPLACGEAGGDGVMGCQAVMVGHGHVPQTEFLGLPSQQQGVKTAVATDGVAVKVQLTWTALRPNGPQHRGERV
jgi:hypothetical protein